MKALSIAALLLAAGPAHAAADPAAVVAAAYVRARTADALGDLQASASSYAAALALAPGDDMIAIRAYRAALAAGDRSLAIRALKSLETADKLPADGRLVLLTDAVANHDWPAADRIAGTLQEDVYGFVLPELKAWIAYGAKQGDPLAPLRPGPSSALAATPPLQPGALPANPFQPRQISPYAAEHRAIMLLALGRTEEGVAATRALADAGQPVRLRLLAASALARSGQKDRALALVDGEEAPLVVARARIAAGQPPLPAVYSAADGIADLLVHVAADINRERIAPASLALARMASWLSPGNATAWLTIAEVLNQAGRPDAALIALGNVPATDMFADAAAGLRLRLLIAKNDKIGALAEAQARVAQPQAGIDDWVRLGDLFAELDRQREAADAYGKALALAEAAKRPNDDLWPILLLQGGALDQAGDWPAAKLALTRAQSLSPDQAVVLNYLGYAQLEKRENVTEARQLVERASKLRPDDPSITDSLGWSYYLTGDLPHAIEALERAAQGDPAQSTINEHLGDAYWRAGRRYEARYSWSAALVQAEDASAKRIRVKIDGGLTKHTAAP